MRERAEAGKAEKARQLLKKKLAAMENKLLIGGELMDKAQSKSTNFDKHRLSLKSGDKSKNWRELAEREGNDDGRRAVCKFV